MVILRLTGGAVLLAAFLGWGCAGDRTGYDLEKLRKERERSDVLVRAHLNRQLAEIGRAYAQRDARLHAHVTLACLQSIERSPIESIESWHRDLEKAVKVRGSRPYASVLADVAYRLTRTLTRGRLTIAVRLRDAVARTFKRGKDDDAFLGYVRDVSKAGYRIYNLDVVQVAAALTLSDLGVAMTSRGGTPQDVLRVYILHEMCKEREKRRTGAPVARGALGSKKCLELGALVKQGLEKAGYTLPTTEDFGAVLMGGMRTSVLDCFMALQDRAASVMIEQMEEYQACRRGEKLGNWGSSGLSGSGLLTSSLMEGDPADTNSDEWEATGSSTTTTTDEDGNTTESTTTEYKNKSDPSKTKTVTTHQTTDADGDLVDQGAVITDNTADGSRMTAYNDDGSVAGSVYDGKDGTTIVDEHDSQGNLQTRTVSDPDGKNIKIDFENGEPVAIHSFNTDTGEVLSRKKDRATGTWGNTTSNYGEAGSLTSGSTSTVGQPVDDSMPGCARTGLEDLKGAGAAGSGLNPYIIPAPDSPVWSGENQDCLTSLVQNPPQRCPPSVALCLLGKTDQGCGCGSGRGSGGTGGFGDAGRCARMMCGSGETCDPATGTCRDPNTGELFPGRVLPVKFPGRLPAYPKLPDLGAFGRGGTAGLNGPASMDALVKDVGRVSRALEPR